MNDAVAVRYLDGDRHIVTAGLGLTWDLSARERIRFDLFGQAHFLVDRTHQILRTGAMEAPEGMGMRTGGVILVGGWTIALEF